MNWKRGLFRVWLVMSIFWVVSVGYLERSYLCANQLSAEARALLDKEEEEYFRAQSKIGTGYVGTTPGHDPNMELWSKVGDGVDQEGGISWG